MTRRGFDYRRAIRIVRPDLLAQQTPCLPRPGEQLSLFEGDDQWQRDAVARAARLRATRERRSR